MGALSLQPWQWAVIGVAYVLFFVLPAFWMAKRARRDGDNAFVWTALVLVGSFMGVYEYFHHRSILRRRERRAEKAKSSSTHAEEAGRPETPRDDGGR